MSEHDSLWVEYAYNTAKAMAFLGNLTPQEYVGALALLSGIPIQSERISSGGLLGGYPISGDFIARLG